MNDSDATCIECARRWTDRHERWRACRLDLPDENDESELAVFCSECAAREFATYTIYESKPGRLEPPAG